MKTCLQCESKRAVWPKYRQRYFCSEECALRFLDETSTREEKLDDVLDHLAVSGTVWCKKHKQWGDDGCDQCNEDAMYDARDRQ